eukprot:m.145312 g.145312  ORF g.145312 m.145312 type:complete len:121 (-) comp52675_c1_seq14:1491-1853(-)
MIFCVEWRHSFPLAKYVCPRDRFDRANLLKMPTIRQLQMMQGHSGAFDLGEAKCDLRSPDSPQDILIFNRKNEMSSLRAPVSTGWDFALVMQPSSPRSLKSVALEVGDTSSCTSCDRAMN